MSRYKTEQEAFWAGEFGDAYIGRNADDHLLAANLALFSRALARTGRPGSCIEFGANIGMNLRALGMLFPDMERHAIEINAAAVAALNEFLPPQNVHHASILEFAPQRHWDVVLVKGVLIHIEPASLPEVYERLHQATGRHLLICEYYNPTPVSIAYRGHADRLFKRDFCGEVLDRFGDLRLVDYGFVYRRDPGFPQDDLTWFLLEKAGHAPVGEGQ